MIILSNVLAVLPVVFMAIGVQECAFRIRAGLGLIDPKDEYDRVFALRSIGRRELPLFLMEADCLLFSGPP